MIGHDDSVELGMEREKVMIPDDSDVRPYEHMMAHDDPSEHPENERSARKNTEKDGRRDADRGRVNPVPNEGEKESRRDQRDRDTRKEAEKESRPDQKNAGKEPHRDVGHEDMSQVTTDSGPRNKNSTNTAAGDSKKEMKDILFATEAEKVHGPSASATAQGSEPASNKDAGARESSKRRLPADPAESAPNKSRNT